MSDIIRLSAALFTASLLTGAASHAHAQETETEDEVLVTATRVGASTTATATTIITKEEIERSPARTLPALLSYQAGIQSRDLYGGGTAKRATVDMRGFGAAGTQNSLVLVNGRRINDFDLASINFAAIPLENVERIEITRGQAAGVLYGDGAVGGVINIITRERIDPGFTGALSGTLGTDSYAEGDFSLSGGTEDVGVSLSGNVIDGDGYRDNNEIRQKVLLGELRGSLGPWDSYLTLDYSDQDLGLPGARSVNAFVNELVSDREGTSTPFDYAEEQLISATGGASRDLGDWGRFVLDAGVRSKDQQAAFFSPFGPAFDSFIDTQLYTFTLTPRLFSDFEMGGLPVSATSGIDLIVSDYESDRALNEGDAPIHRYEGEQVSAAIYTQADIDLDERNTLVTGVRLQGVSFDGTDRFDPTAPGANALFDSQQPAVDETELQWSANLGLEHELTRTTTLYGRTGRNFRLPTIDERVKPFTGKPMDLDTQTSVDFEAGVIYNGQDFTLEAAAFWIELEDEIHFNPATFENENFDPTRRRGVELSGQWWVTDFLTLGANVTYLKAEFTSGQYDGNDVPLVSELTGSANAAVDFGDGWTATGVVSYYGDKRMDNDESNFQPKIPDYWLVDLKLIKRFENFFVEGSVNNLFDEEYYDYAAASASTFGAYNAYPLPGRSFFLKAGVTF